LPVRIRRPFRPDDVDGVWYVIAAAPHDVNGCVLTESTTRGVLVNAVDDPANATAFAGSVFTCGPVTVALSTGGEAPALSRVLREALEQLIGHDIEHWTTLAATLRREWSETACRWWSDATLCSRRSLTCTSKTGQRDPNATPAQGNGSEHPGSGQMSEYL
jgi:siroheme synthase-like protein